MGSKPGCYKYKVITMLSLNIFKTNDPMTMRALRECGILKYFRVPGMRTYV